MTTSTTNSQPLFNVRITRDEFSICEPEYWCDDDGNVHVDGYTLPEAKARIEELYQDKLAMIQNMDNQDFLRFMGYLND